MARINLTRQVKGCNDCPFAVHAGYCGLHPQKIEITDQLIAGTGLMATLDAVEPMPGACPLRRHNCVVSLKYDAPKPGRKLPPVTVGRDFDAEVKHFRLWLGKQNRNQWNKTGLTIELTELAKANEYGPELKVPHLRAAVAARRPFHEGEFDKVVAYAVKHQKYQPLPERPRFSDESDNILMNL